MIDRLFPAALLLLLGSQAQAGEWNQWRGPSRSGAVSEETPWPEKLSEEHLTQLWKVDLAEGYSGPISDGLSVFTLATRDKKQEIARSFQLADGSQNWQVAWDGAMKVPFFAASNGSWIRSTPALHEGALYAGGMRDVLVKLDATTGKEIWRIDFTKREKTDVPAFGQVCSPLVDGNAIYLQAGLAVARINAETGETIWRTMEDKRAMFGSAFSSPILATLCGKRQLLVQGRLALAGLDPETGAELWSTPVKAFRGMNILTPTPIGENKVFTASYGGGSFLYQINKSDDGSFSIETLWNNEKAEGYMGNPIILGDHVYLHGRNKKFHCLSLADGNVAWSSDEEFGEYWSMIHQGDRILALDQKGELLLIDANPETLTITDRRAVSPSDTTWAHLGIAGNKLLIRSLKGLSVWEWK